MFATVKTLLMSSLMVAAPSLVFAQTAPAEKMIARVEKTVLTLAGARIVAAAAETEAKRLNTTGAVAVVDDGGNLLYLLRIDNTFPAGSSSPVARWSEAKRPLLTRFAARTSRAARPARSPKAT